MPPTITPERIPESSRRRLSRFALNSATMPLGAIAGGATGGLATGLLGYGIGEALNDDTPTERRHIPSNTPLPDDLSGPIPGDPADELQENREKAIDEIIRGLEERDYTHGEDPKERAAQNAAIGSIPGLVGGGIIGAMLGRVRAKNTPENYRYLLSSKKHANDDSVMAQGRTGVVPPPAFNQTPKPVSPGAATASPNPIENKPDPSETQATGIMNQHQVPKAYNPLSGVGQIANKQLNLTSDPNQLTQQQVGQQFKGLQNNYQQGNYFNTYQDAMGLIGKMKAHNPNLPGAMSPLMQNQMGGWGSTAWNALNAWHGMVGDPGNFAKTLSGLAPGLLRGAGNLGMAGPLGLYGLVSGNKQTMTDLHTLMGGGRTAAK